MLGCVDRMILGLQEKFLGVTASTVEGSEPGASIVEDLERIHDLLGASSPTPVAIWFIDRPLHYNDFLAQIRGTKIRPMLEQPSSLDGIVPICYMGIPIRCVALQEIYDYAAGLLADACRGPHGSAVFPPSRQAIKEVSKRIARLYPFIERGIYVQMSKGQHWQIKEWLPCVEYPTFMPENPGKTRKDRKKEEKEGKKNNEKFS